MKYVSSSLLYRGMTHKVYIPLIRSFQCILS